jgi:hypothetical protein
MTAAVGYSGRPLAAKLGVRAGGRCCWSARRTGSTWPRRRGGGRSRRAATRTTWCWRSARTAPRCAAGSLPGCRLTTAGALWIAWPKRSVGWRPISTNVVRAHGLAVGLVDVKVAAVDATWSGLKFVRRVADR